MEPSTYKTGPISVKIIVFAEICSNRGFNHGGLAHLIGLFAWLLWTWKLAKANHPPFPRSFMPSQHDKLSVSIALTCQLNESDSQQQKRNGIARS